MIRTRRFARTMLACLAALPALACSSTSSPPGELMVTVETDIAIPKDIDQVQIDVSVRGQVALSNTYDVGPQALKLPASLGVLAGKDPAAPVTIRAIGRQKGKARVLNKAVTTIPQNRVAELRLSLDFLCIGKVTETSNAGDPQTLVDSSCGGDQTCRGGDCVGSTVDSSALPTYSAGSGGSSSPDNVGVCFDTNGCFSLRSKAEVDLKSCTIAKPAGDANVALVLKPGRDGICSSTECLVPLSQGASGWTDAGAQIKLPSSVCTQLSDGTVREIAVTSWCRTKTESLPLCGAGATVHAPCSGTCQTLAFAQNNPTSIAISGGDVVFVNDVATGEVVRVPRAGGPLAQIAGAMEFPTQIAVDDSGIFWALERGYVFRLAPGTTTPKNIFPEDYVTTGRLGLSATDVLLPMAASDGVKKIKKDGTDAAVFVSGQGGVHGAAVSGDTLYYTAADALRTTSLTSSAPKDLAKGLGGPQDLAVDASFVYATLRDAGTVVKIARADGQTTVLASGRARPWAIAIDATFAYFTEYAEGGAVWKVPLAGGAPATVADHQPFAASIAVDETHVYWSIPGQGRVHRAPK